jgi:hypothetical protein
VRAIGLRSPLGCSALFYEELRNRQAAGLAFIPIRFPLAALLSELVVASLLVATQDHIGRRPRVTLAKFAADIDPNDSTEFTDKPSISCNDWVDGEAKGL